MIAAPVVEASVALGAGSELVVLVFEQDVEPGERSVTARESVKLRGSQAPFTELQIDLFRFAQFAWHAVPRRRRVAHVHLLLETLQIPSEKHAEYCRAEYEPAYNRTNQNVAHPALPRSDTPTFR